MSALAGRHAVVTGGGSGIGAATARALAEAGARITLIGRTPEKIATIAEALGGGHQAADVADAAQVAAAFAAAVDAGGPVDVLINNAGAAEAMPFTKMTAELWERMLAVNLSGVYHCTRAVIPGMAKARWGRIVNVASTAALTGYAYVSAYCAAKHGVLGLTRSLALEFAAKGITVNAVCPGYTDTDIVARAVDNIVESTGRSTEEARAELVKANPQGRLIRPQEVADAVLWLCQQESVNGQAIAVDGGEVM